MSKSLIKEMSSVWVKISSGKLQKFQVESRHHTPTEQQNIGTYHIGWGSHFTQKMNTLAPFQTTVFNCLLCRVSAEHQAFHFALHYGLKPGCAKNTIMKNEDRTRLDLKKTQTVLSLCPFPCISKK